MVDHLTSVIPIWIGLILLGLGVFGFAPNMVGLALDISAVPFILYGIFVHMNNIAFIRRKQNNRYYRG